MHTKFCGVLNWGYWQRLWWEVAYEMYLAGCRALTFGEEGPDKGTWVEQLGTFEER